MTNKFKLVIFDLDGTLADSSQDVVECFNYALQSEGIPPADPEAIKKTIGYPLEEALAKYGDPLVLYDRFIEKARDEMGSNTLLLPGAEETLSQLCLKGVEIAIATTKIRVHTQRIIKKLGIERFIGELSCADDVKDVKPAPEVILRLLKIMGFHAREALMVGDTINDIISAQSAGVKVAALACGFDPINLIKSKNPDWILTDIRQVTEIIHNDRPK